MYRIFNVQTNPIAIPILGTDETLIEDFEPDDEGRHHKVFRKEVYDRVHETVFIEGTHYKELHDPVYHDVSNKDFQAMQKVPLFKRMVESKKIRVEKLTEE